MTKPISFQGVYPILATPFRDDEVSIWSLSIA
jgi:hypothetical protein